MTPDVTSLLNLLPEMPRLPAIDALAGTPASAPAPGGAAGAAAPDFAGLLEALAAPPPASAPALPIAAVAAPLPANTAPVAAPAVEVGDTPPPTPPQSPLIAVPRAETPPATALAAWPTGKNLPEPGALLPPALPLAAPAEAGPVIPPPVERPVAAPESLPGLVMVLRPAAPDEVPADAVSTPLPDADAAERPQPPIHARMRSLDPAAPALPAPLEAAPALTDEAAPLAEPQPATDLAPMQAAVPDPGTAPQPIAPVLTFVPVLADDAVAAALAPAESAARAAAPSAAPVAGPVAAAPIAAALPVPLATRPAPATRGPSAPPGVPVDMAQTPARVGLPAAPTASSAPDAGGETADADTSSVPAPALPAEPASASASTSGTRVSPDAGNPAPAPAANLPATLAPVLPQAAAMMPAERPADPRAVAANPPAPQLESTIAQVGDIREALRAARPAMTLQHAEFGAVSIRLEPAAPDQWRAVLASRDPGFVPAIQAALDARAIAAASDTSTNLAGQNGASQNGASDHRYGASPNGGQGSPQPYLGQSGSRDGEAAPDHRRPSTAAALAARGDGEAEDPAAASSASGGLFA